MKRLIYLLALTSVSSFGQQIEGLIAHYPFDGNCNIISPNTNIPDGIADTDGISYVAGIKGIPNTAIKISGNDGASVDLGNNSIYKFDTDSKYSISLWVKVDSVSAFNAILVKHDAISDNDIWDYGILLKGGMPYTGTHLGENVETDININNEKWNHLVATYNSGVHKLYVNNVLEVTGNADIGVSDGKLILGQKESRAANYYGVVDELKIFSKALDSVDISKLFDEKNTGDENCITADFSVIPLGNRIAPLGDLI